MGDALVDDAIGSLLAATPSKMTFEDICDFHYRFELIHPFQDGNGRVGRLVMFGQCLANGIMPFIVTDAEKAFYYRGLAEYAHIPGFLRDTLRHFQDLYYYRYVGYLTLPRDLEAKLVEPAEGRQVRTGEAGSSGNIGHVEVFRMASVRTPIIGRPRPLSGQRRAGPTTPCFVMSRL